eukprot:SAG11_NODE_283_length_11241_cov_8.234428_2_plen_177_part_00
MSSANVQALYHTPEFRAAVYKFCYEVGRHGAEERCIPLQLQRLFALMQLGNRAAVSTRPLTAAFGWTAADAFQQHDVQELNRVLFDALQTASPEVFGTLSSLYSGKLIDYIQDKRWPAEGAVRRTRDDVFMDVQLTVGGSTSVHHALERFTTAEEMSGPNQVRQLTSTVTLMQQLP